MVNEYWLLTPGYDPQCQWKGRVMGVYPLLTQINKKKIIEFSPLTQMKIKNLPEKKIIKDGGVFLYSLLCFNMEK